MTYVVLSQNFACAVSYPARVIIVVAVFVFCKWKPANVARINQFPSSREESRILSARVEVVAYGRVSCPQGNPRAPRPLADISLARDKLHARVW